LAVPGNDHLTAALYARVSSEQQAKEQTLASQVEALRQRVRQDGLTLPEELCFLDEGAIGGTLLRPALARLRDQAAAGALDRLSVHAPDRLARTYAYQVLLLDELKRFGVEVVFLNRPIGCSPEEERVGERWPRPLRGQPEHGRRAYSTYRTAAADQVAIPVPALVEPALFAAVAEQLEENKKRQRQSARGARYLLQGLVVCTRCGHAFYGKPVSRASAKGKARYACYRGIGTDAYRFGGERLCRVGQVRTDRRKAAVWEDIRALLADPGRVHAEYERRRSGTGRDEASEEQLRART
jgi:hypothetical protein